MMHQTDWNQYFYHLQQHIEQQDIRIKILEKQIEELKDLQEKQKGMTIEKIEYKFDQLKIETLSGSLHIGLSPDDLSQIEDFALGHQQQQYPTNLSPLDQEILAELEHWCYHSGREMIRDLANQLDYQIDDSQTSLFIQDIQSQFPMRILHYKQQLENDRSVVNEQDMKAFMIEKIQQEVYQSLRKYMKNEKDSQ